MVQEMPSPRMMPETCLPTWRSRTGRQGTRVNSRDFSTTAYFRWRVRRSGGACLPPTRRSAPRHRRDRAGRKADRRHGQARAGGRQPACRHDRRSGSAPCGQGLRRWATAGDAPGPLAPVVLAADDYLPPAAARSGRLSAPCLGAIASWAVSDQRYVRRRTPGPAVLSDAMNVTPAASRAVRIAVKLPEIGTREPLSNSATVDRPRPAAVARSCCDKLTRERAARQRSAESPTLSPAPGLAG